MPQFFHVLRCFSCETYQVHQVKKSNKWLCKMCGEKQSVLKVYGEGQAVECRKYVQELNMLRSNPESLKPATQWDKQAVGGDGGERHAICVPSPKNEVNHKTHRWSQYEEERQEDRYDEDDELGELFTTSVSTFKKAQAQHRKIQREKYAGGEQCIAPYRQNTNTSGRTDEISTLTSTYSHHHKRPQYDHFEAHLTQTTADRDTNHGIPHDEPVSSSCVRSRELESASVTSSRVTSCERKSSRWGQYDQGEDDPTDESSDDVMTDSESFPHTDDNIHNPTENKDVTGPDRHAAPAAAVSATRIASNPFSLNDSEHDIDSLLTLDL